MTSDLLSLCSCRSPDGWCQEARKSWSQAESQEWAQDREGYSESHRSAVSHCATTPVLTCLLSNLLICLFFLPVPTCSLTCLLSHFLTCVLPFVFSHIYSPVLPGFWRKRQPVRPAIRRKAALISQGRTAATTSESKTLTFRLERGEDRPHHSQQVAAFKIVPHSMCCCAQMSAAGGGVVLGVGPAVWSDWSERSGEDHAAEDAS